MLTEHPTSAAAAAAATTAENVAYSKQITGNSKLSSPTMVPSSTEKILLNVTTTDTLTSVEQQQFQQHQGGTMTPRHNEEAAQLQQSTPTTEMSSPAAVATVEPLPTASASVTVVQPTMDQYKSNYSIKFTTFRPCKKIDCGGPPLTSFLNCQCVCSERLNGLSNSVIYCCSTSTYFT